MEMIQENIDFHTLTKINDIEKKENIVHLKSESSEIKIIFYKPDIIRIWMDSTGEFKDPTEGKLIAKDSFTQINIELVDNGTYFKIKSDKCVIRAYKDQLKFAMYDFRDITPIWEEDIPLQYSEKTTKQTLKTKDDEYFYGGGVQNGYFLHKNKKIHIENVISHWNDGSVSNPAPFYISTAGYGAYRNTFSTGLYEFHETAVINHNENRFDCFYFYGPSLKQILNNYTEITGRPTLIPRWGFGLGDADCYNTSNTTYSGTHNKPNKETTIDVLKIAKTYRDYDMPGSWILPNDGYGCGYKDLDFVVKECWDKYGFRIGLWTENGVEKIAHEVGVLGSRLCKLDVAWVGPGYEFALNASKTAFEGIENSSSKEDSKGSYSERGYVWSVCGWAGTQRYSGVWTGDQSGNWEYIRFHIPTYIGAGLSGITYIGSDIDGIFGGSAKTQVRDLQWKIFTPIMINMSGWAERDKQPWIWGEPYTSINRKYLKLRQRLMPYIYSYANESYETGLPIVRGMVLEFPKDSFAKTKNTQYQFMCGEWFLIAPIYEDKEVRNEIYLPDGTWIDYWTGKQYKGGKVINNYISPLDTLPVFVRAGAIIPMNPENLYEDQYSTNEQYPMTIEVYPSGTTTFELYEDDGHTTLHRQGKFAKTIITSSENDEELTVTIGETKGSYDGMPFARKYEFKIHTTVNPQNIKFIKGEAIGSFNEVYSYEEWENSKCCCWYHDKDDQNGVLYIKTKAVPLHSEFNINLEKFSSQMTEEKTVDIPVPETPRNFRIAEAEDTKLKLEWNSVNYAGFYELEADSIVYTYLTDSFIHSDLEFLSTHKYKIRAVNASGSSLWSEEIVGETLEDKMKDAIPFEELSAYSTSCLGESRSADKAVDGETSTNWISNYKFEKLPQSITIDISKIYDVEKIIYFPRGENERAVITKYNLYISEDGRRFVKFINEGTWIDDGNPKTINLNNSKVKSIRLEALQCSTPDFPGASVEQINILATPGSDGKVAGDYTGDGKVDMADLNFVLQYYGAKDGDNDWSYVSKADTNKDGVIGIYDVAYTAGLIEPRIKSKHVDIASGDLKLKYNRSTVKANEEFTVEIIGENVVDLYAFESIINLDNNKYKFLDFETSEISKNMISACKEKNGKLLVAYTNLSDREGISGSGVFAKVKFISNVEGVLDIHQEKGTIVGANFDVVVTSNSEVSECNRNLFEFQISKDQMAASATSEQEETGDGSVASVFDRKPNTHWHTPWNKSAILPQSIIADLGCTYNVSKLMCKLRGIGANGVITSYEVYCIDSNDVETKVAEGKWEDDGKVKTIFLEKPTSAAKVRLQANEGKGGFATMVELDIYAVIDTEI
jgi:alpha-glucosidase (family GH31 glycosyl hydrolase)